MALQLDLSTWQSGKILCLVSRPDLVVIEVEVDRSAVGQEILDKVRFKQILHFLAYPMFHMLNLKHLVEFEIECWVVATFPLEQWFSTFFDAFLHLLSLELFIPLLLHKFNRMAEELKHHFCDYNE